MVFVVQYIKAYWYDGFAYLLLYVFKFSLSWAAAIVLAVNIIIFPVTSEKELRRMLLLSLEHVATFSHLLAKVGDLKQDIINR